MNISQNSHGTGTLILGSLLLAAAVMIGAFGAHGLEKIVDESYLKTYHTGVTYHFYHALGLLMLGLIERVYGQSFKLPKTFFLLGILFFSSNCYFYTLTQQKIFAMLVPIGGLAFIIGWLALAWGLYKVKDSAKS